MDLLVPLTSLGPPVNRDIGEARAAFGRPYGLDIDYDSTVFADQALKVAPGYRHID